MTDRLPVHALDPTGATDGQSPKYDAAAGRVVWADGSTGGGGGVSVAVPAYDFSNATPTGVVQILDDIADGFAEKLIAGMDATGLTPGIAADVTIDLWISENRNGSWKYAKARLRDGGLTGPILAELAFPAAAVDSTAGHEREWSLAGSYTPTSDRLVVTIQAVTGANGGAVHDAFSDTRTFTVHQDATTRPIEYGDLADVDLTGLADGDVPTWDAVSGAWVPTTPATGSVPAGGTTGQVLKKASNADGDVAWATDNTGAGGGSGYPPGSADAKPAVPNAKDDEFDGTSTVTWTTTPTAPNLTDRNTTRPDHLFIKTAGSGANYVGRYQPVPASYPYKITTKLDSSWGRANYHRAGGIILVPASPTSTSNIYYGGVVYNAFLATQRVIAQFGGSFVSQSSATNFGGRPWYIRVTVNSATSVTLETSLDGWAWWTVESAFNPGFTPAFMGLALNEESGGSPNMAMFDFFRVS